jgi:hypothetical protein
VGSYRAGSWPSAGVYALTGKEKDIGETQLAYKLELPEVREVAL